MTNPTREGLTDEQLDRVRRAVWDAHPDLEPAEYQRALMRAAIETQTQATRAERRPLPHPGSPEASAMLDSVLTEYQWPANPKNAARAGWEAAQRWLTHPEPEHQTNKESGMNWTPWGSGPPPPPDYALVAAMTPWGTLVIAQHRWGMCYDANGSAWSPIWGAPWMLLPPLPPNVPPQNWGDESGAHHTQGGDLG